VGQLQNVHKKNIETLIDERQKSGPFQNLEDLLWRVSLPPKEVDNLIRGGALDSIAHGLNRPQLMRQHALFRARGLSDRSAGSGLFDNSNALPVPYVHDYSLKQKLNAEAETFGFVVSRHPLFLYEDKFKDFTVVPANELHRYVGRTVNLAGWHVTRKRLRTKDDEPMAFITFEDTAGLYETVIFPREYDRLAPLISATGPFLVTGEVTEELGVLTLTVKKLQLLSSKHDSSNSVSAETPCANETEERAA
jgi:error-prone DNA polymerase